MNQVCQPRPCSSQRCVHLRDLPSSHRYTGAAQHNRVVPGHEAKAAGSHVFQRDPIDEDRKRKSKKSAGRTFLRSASQIQCEATLLNCLGSFMVPTTHWPFTNPHPHPTRAGLWISTTFLSPSRRAPCSSFRPLCMKAWLAADYSRASGTYKKLQLYTCL